MREDLLEVVAILDMSGSMRDLANDTICGFNSYISELAKGEGEARITLITFNTVCQIVWEHKSVKDCPAIDSSVYHPEECTALTDAIGIAIDNMKRHIDSLPEEQKPGRVSFFISTDGDENSSKKYRQLQIKEMIVRQTEEEKWEFIFAGANIDAFAASNAYGIQQQNVANIHANGMG